MRNGGVTAGLAFQTFDPPHPFASSRSLLRFRLALSRVAAIRPAAQRLQIVVVVASALLKRYAAIDIVVCSDDTAALTRIAVTLQHSTTYRHPAIATNTRRCSCLGLQHRSARSSKRLDSAW